MPPNDTAVSMKEAGRRLGLTPQAVGMLARQCPADCVRIERGKRDGLCWPQFPTWYRTYLQRERRPTPRLDDARARKADAEAELAELKASLMRGDLVRIEDVDSVWVARLTRLRTTILNLSCRFAHRTVGIDSLVASQVIWDRAMVDVLKVLSGAEEEDSAKVAHARRRIPTPNDGAPESPD